MAQNIVWSTLYLGNFGDLELDETAHGMDDPTVLLTTFGGGPGGALATNIVDVHTYDSYDDIVQTDNTGTPNYIEYDLGAGTATAKIDSVVVLHGTVSFYDGTTYESNFGLFQDDNGNLFMVVLDTQPELASAGVDSVTFTSVVQNDFEGVNQFNKDDYDFVCFGPGTRIDTPFGPKRADKLRVGDLVTTLDDGPQPIRWIGKRRLRFEGPNRARPVRIAADAFGPGLPRREMFLSPNHRLLVTTEPSYALHDPLGALAPAKALTRLPGIRVAEGRRAISYFSFLLPTHAVLIAEGIAAESLYPGPDSFATLTGPERSDWLRLADEERVTGTPPARLLLTPAETRAALASRSVHLPDTAPVPLSWSARSRRPRPLPTHLARPA